MLGYRVIPVLLYSGTGLTKTIRFKNHRYIGDAVNAVRILNEKEVDELVFLDISATPKRREPDYRLIADVASEAFMPMAYGGGITTAEQARQILRLGVEKISINSAAVANPAVISEIAGVTGSQSVIASIDVKRNLRGRYEVLTAGGQKRTGLDPVRFAQQMELLGAGEILLNSIDRDGTMEGYDLALLRQVTNAVRIPVVACGGAGKLEDFRDARQGGGASAVAAGSMFVFQGKHRAVLISYPSQAELEGVFRAW